MLPGPLFLFKPFALRACRIRRGVAVAAIMAVTCPQIVHAQDAAASAPPAAGADQSGPIGFEADTIEYRDASELVTASGNVVLRRDGKSLRSDTVTWNRKSGQIVATGNIRSVDEDGNQLFTDRIELTDELKAGAMDNMLLALRAGGRLAAVTGKRDATGAIVLDYAAYSGCAVEDSDGCPKTPSWRITSREVVYDPARKKVKFRGARLELFGIRLMPLPGLTIATDGRAVAGPLVPDFRLSPSNGVEMSEAYYQRLSNNRDITATGYFYTKAPPMLELQYRALTSIGAYQITGYATNSKLIPLADGATTTQTQFRGYVFANGRFQLTPNWSVTASVRAATDRTFLRRYNISLDDRLRSTVNAERIDDNSYLTIAGWATQTMRVGDQQGLVPVALPAIDYHWRVPGPLLGGKLEVQANSLGIMRASGQDTQRAFASAQWNRSGITGSGQEISLTALVRGDVYHSSDNSLTNTVAYQGNPGWQARGIATAALDVKWPLVGSFMGGTQVLVPRIQLVASPALSNLAVPNEDSRAIDLENSNLFALSRFPGYDRVEDGVRITYGFDWQFERPGWRVNATIGQSYRFSGNSALFPDGTGLSGKVSDIVGRTEIRFRDFIKLTHRYRLDMSGLAVRRNEIDATIGNERTYLELGYTRLNRNISPLLEDLKDSNELRAAGRIAFAHYWSLFGSGVFNLSDNSSTTTLTSAGTTTSTTTGFTGFEPLRTRVGAAYQDDCLEISLTWRRDYITTGDAQRGNTFEFHIALRNLGFR